MRRAALFLLTLSLLAFGCEVGALCSMAEASDGSCCCPLMDAMGMEAMEGMNGTPPCMEESEKAPMPLDAEATFDGSSLTWTAAPTPAVPWPADVPRSFGPASEADVAAGSGPALYLLGCAFLN